MNFNRHLLLSTAVAAFLVAAMPVSHAATTNANFNVTVNLTATCEISTTPTDVAFTYTSFQAGVANSTGGDFGVRCTNTLPYTLSLDSTTGTVIGLNYSLSVPAATFNGNGLEQLYAITGTMAAGQSGTCATTPPGTCNGTDVRTLIVTY